MSQLLIQRYLNELHSLRRVSGTKRESVVREAFKTLLKDWGRSHDLIFLPEHDYETATKTRVRPDGTLMYELRVPFGYWEAKDTDDDLNEEIEKKFRKGYPQDNIIFDDSHEAVLIQNKQRVMRCDVKDPAQLQKLLERYFSYERPEIRDFRKAVEQFKVDLPAVLKALRDMIGAAERDNRAFHQAAISFLKHAQETINPKVVAADVREMLIQHILTEEIFSQVFDDSNFHRQNNVAKKLYALENTFFKGKVKHDTLAVLRPYYAAIRSAAALVSSHHEKQHFLKTIYENFYKVYDRKKADRLGVVYTPNEIVRFMIESADWLCQKHFGKSLIDKNVEILDPAAGTGTFITELIEHFRGQSAKLKYKYLEEMHANEVAILPYYVANLNIESTYAVINGYDEYPNLCFVDTLDNTAALRAYKGQQGELFGAVSEENVARIRRQNTKKISVIIGNPPYNANQLNENENNKNREYPEIDKRIRETYIDASTAHKTKLYDMYARFFRWASDRVNENGILAFITNRSFIDKRGFDGFRKIVAEEFNAIYVVDLGGDWKGEGVAGGGNVFGIGTGVAISFLIKKTGAPVCQVIQYASSGENKSGEEKNNFLNSTPIWEITFEKIKPDAANNWLNQSDTNFTALIPLVLPKLSGKRSSKDIASIFSLFTHGCVSNRDDWVYAFSRSALAPKVQEYVNVFNRTHDAIPRPLPKDWETRLDYSIKWTQDARMNFERGRKLEFRGEAIRSSLYRPFVKKSYYYSEDLNWSLYRMERIFAPDGAPNEVIVFSDPTSQKPFMTLSANAPFDLHLVGAASGAIGISKVVIGSDGSRSDNVTDWALKQFQTQYAMAKGALITKDAIFSYVYGVLHDPIYRKQYAINLKRELPRIPLYADFWQWVEWGEKLMALHVGYETAKPWPLNRIDALDEKARKAGLAPKVVLRADKDIGNIQLDSETQLTGVPPEAWTYELGNRSALEWILDQYKEKRPKDPTIREKFNTYRFADQKEKVIDLLKRVTRVSVETMQNVDAMRSMGMDGRTNS
jgi:predicted helicase